MASSSRQSLKLVSQEKLFVKNKRGNTWYTTQDHVAKLMYSFKESEDMFIPKGTVYKPTKWMTKEGIVVDEPHTVDQLSFASDDRFRKWMH